MTELLAYILGKPMSKLVIMSLNAIYLKRIATIKIVILIKIIGQQLELTLKVDIS